MTHVGNGQGCAMRAGQTKSIVKARELQLTLLALLLFASIAATAVYFIELNSRYQHRLRADVLASNYAQLIQGSVTRAVSATYPLAAYVRNQQGSVSGFEKLATELLPYYPGVASLQLAPDGIVQHIVPLAGNEKAIGHNLLKDPKRTKEAFLARDTGKLTLAGPFPLLQGGIGAVARLPVYLDTPDKAKRFWGFSAVLIRLPLLLDSVHLVSLSTHGLDYELYRIHPDSGKKQIIQKSVGRELNDPVKQTIRVPGAEWTLSVSPKQGWSSTQELATNILTGLLFAVLAAYITKQAIKINQHKQQLELEVVTRTNELKMEHQRLAEIIWAADVGTWELNLVDGMIKVNDRLLKIIGYSLDELQPFTAERWSALLHPEDQAKSSRMLEKSFSRETTEYEMECRLKHKGGHWVWVLNRGKIAQWDATDKPLRMSGILSDISQRKQNEEAIEQAHALIKQLSQRQQLLLESAGEGIFGLDTDGKISFINPAALKMLELTEQAALGRNAHELFHHHHPNGEEYPEHNCPIYQVIKEGEKQVTEDYFFRQSGRMFPVHLSATPIMDGRTQVGGEVVFRDISEQKEQERHLKLLATMDTLTGTSNRRHFLELLEVERVRIQRMAKPAALLMLDLDHFKLINDTYGHAAGDKVLELFAQTVHSTLRKIDLFGRLGGEEFAILLPETEVEAAHRFAERLRQHVANRVVQTNQQKINVTVSIGITAMTKQDEHCDIALARADAALYKAKAKGRDRVVSAN